MLDSEHEHIVLVHYRDLSQSSSSSVVSNTTQQPLSTMDISIYDYVLEDNDFNANDPSSLPSLLDEIEEETWTQMLNDFQTPPQTNFMPILDDNGLIVTAPPIVPVEQKFTILGISPEWGFADAFTEVYIVWIVPL